MINYRRHGTWSDALSQYGVGARFIEYLANDVVSRILRRQKKTRSAGMAPKPKLRRQTKLRWSVPAIQRKTKGAKDDATKPKSMAVLVARIK